MQPWIITHRPAPLGHLTCRLTPYYKLKLSYCITLPAHPEALAYHYPPAALLYPPKTLQTALASTHAYKPAHTLFLPSSLFGAAAPSPLSRIRLPLPVLDLFLSPRQRFSCLTASPPPAPYLGLCTFVPCPAQPRARWLAMDLAVVQCRRQTVAASGSNQRCERSYYCPPGTSTEYLPTCHHYMRTPRLALFFGSHAHHCASREVLGAPCKYSVLVRPRPQCMDGPWTHTKTSLSHRPFAVGLSACCLCRLALR